MSSVYVADQDTQLSGRRLGGSLSCEISQECSGNYLTFNCSSALHRGQLHTGHRQPLPSEEVHCLLSSSTSSEHGSWEGLPKLRRLTSPEAADGENGGKGGCVREVCPPVSSVTCGRSRCVDMASSGTHSLVVLWK